MTTTTTQPEPITDANRRVYDAIVSWIEERGYSPTVRELCQELGVASPNGINGHLKVLERRGWITRSNRQSRTIRPTGGVR